jgi:UDP-N-acetylmuramoyl-tripeptide--D-alanyl-D-alanine ligase
MNLIGLTIRDCFDLLDSAVLLQSRAANLQRKITGISTDTRSIVPGNLFVALRGETFDGNQKVLQALLSGASGALLDNAQIAREISATHPDAQLLLVSDARHGLAQLARRWRSRFNLPLIAVTGSNGKTTVKEMIASIFRAAVGPSSMLSTQGNLNNDIGVPLTLFGLNTQTQLAVVELGMNHPGEISHLAKTALPTVALVNNAQREHQEFMHSVQAVAIENGAVIAALGAQGIAVFPADDPFTALWRQLAGTRQVITFGWSGPGLQPLIHAAADSRAQSFVIHAEGQQWPIQLNIAGRHNVRNALAAVACCRAAGVSWSAITTGLAEFVPFAGRLEVSQVHHQARIHTVVDDTYNANPDSVLAAIDVLHDMAHPQLLVLGDMGEVGDQGPQFHVEVGQHAAKQQIDQLFTFGDLAQLSSQACVDAGGRAKHFDAIDGEHGLLAALDADLLQSEKDITVLVKGSRFMRMERVVKHLAGGQH